MPGGCVEASEVLLMSLLKIVSHQTHQKRQNSRVRVPSETNTGMITHIHSGCTHTIDCTHAHTHVKKIRLTNDIKNSILTMPASEI